MYREIPAKIIFETGDDSETGEDTVTIEYYIPLQPPKKIKFRGQEWDKLTNK